MQMQQSNVDFVAQCVEKAFKQAENKIKPQGEKALVLAQAMEQIAVSHRSSLQARESLLAVSYSEEEILDLNVAVANAVGFRYCQDNRESPDTVGIFLGIDLHAESVVKLPKLVS